MKRAIAVVDLGYGDAGKGTMTDALAARRDASLIVRFNGGAQAGHNIVTPDGRHHTFSQWGAASFLPGVRTLLSRHIAIHPMGMVEEAAHLRHVGVKDPFARLLVDRRSLVTTPYHQMMNRLRELARGPDRHGSCGVGHGETIADSLAEPELALTAGQIHDRARLLSALANVRERKLAEIESLGLRAAVGHRGSQELEVVDDPDLIEVIADRYQAVVGRLTLLDAHQIKDLLDAEDEVVFEGAQGVLIDEWYGFHPYTTWSTTTFQRAEEIVAEAGYPKAIVERLGVIRSYAVRHGDGPFPSEDAALTKTLREQHNVPNPWQGPMRAGPLDAVALRYAIDVCGHVDALALTHVDALVAMDSFRIAERYRAPSAISPGDAPVESIDTDIIALKKLPEPDLIRQEQLTNLLADSSLSPVYGPPIDQPSQRLDAVVDAVESSLGVPVGWLSSGPTRRDKVEARRAKSQLRPQSRQASR